MLKLTLLVSMLALVLSLSCAEKNASPTSAALPDETWLATVTTTQTFDVGAVHNVAMECMRARAALPMSIAYDEYVRQLARCVNRALASYGLSRSITVEESAQTVALLETEVMPYFDLTFSDPTRLDPNALLHHWLEAGLLTEAEHDDLVRVFAGETVVPTSDVVAIGQSVFGASSYYWLAGAPEPLDSEEPPHKGLVVRSADALGSIAGYWLGAGKVGSVLVSFAASTFFDMSYQGGSGGPSSGDGPGHGYGCASCSLQ
jgi:hypothetical protein